MSFKVVLNSSGQPVAFGPNVAGYVPGVPAGGSLVVQATAPAIIGPVPQSVTRFQARAALSRAGLFTTVNNAMLAFPVGDERRLAWEDAQEFRRTSPTMLQMAAALGLNDAALDALFTTAAGIEA